MNSLILAPNDGNQTSPYGTSNKYGRLVSLIQWNIFDIKHKILYIISQN
jgi:hypothetical protein